MYYLRLFIYEAKSSLNIRKDISVIRDGRIDKKEKRIDREKVNNYSFYLL
jgi:hypothetical protein